MPSFLAAAAASIVVNCWAVAGEAYKLPPYLLYAIASQESSYDPNAVAVARNGTYSVGLMQINSSWFPVLRGAGISEADLYDPCVNIQVGAWILAQGVARYGRTWMAIGSYYAGPYSGRLAGEKLKDYRSYSTQVLARWQSAVAGRLRVDPQQAKTRGAGAVPAFIRYIGGIGRTNIVGGDGQERNSAISGNQ